MKIEIYFVECQPPYVGDRSYVENTFSQLSNLSNYTLNIYTPRVVSKFSMDFTLELVQLCHQNVTEHLPQRQSYEYSLGESYKIQFSNPTCCWLFHIQDIYSVMCVTSVLLAKCSDQIQFNNIIIVDGIRFGYLCILYICQFKEEYGSCLGFWKVNPISNKYFHFLFPLEVPSPE